MPWDLLEANAGGGPVAERARDMHGFVRNLIGIRRASTALRAGLTTTLYVTPILYAFLRGFPNDARLVVLNNSAAAAEVSMPVHANPRLSTLSCGRPPVRAARSNTGVVLGGAVDPFLRSFAAYDPAPQTWTVIAGPLPGDPVAFDISEPPFPLIVLFGERCSPSATAPANYTQGGFPRLGNANFGLTTTGTALIPVLLALGSSDQHYLGLPLPIPLPGGGCGLLVAPEAVFFMTTDSRGIVTLQIPVPPAPTLSGSIVFSQWIHLIGGPLIAATEGMALHLYP